MNPTPLVIRDRIAAMEIVCPLHSLGGFAVILPDITPKALLRLESGAAGGQKEPR
jgi:hypothetical protein